MSNPSITLPNVESIKSNSFDSFDFKKQNFDASKFILERQMFPLSTLHQELQDYLQQVKTQLVELINENYTDFINVSTKLNGVEEGMEKIVMPLSNLKSQVISIQSFLNQKQDSIKNLIERREFLKKDGEILENLIELSNGLDKLDFLLQNDTPLDRCAIEYHQLLYLISKSRHKFALGLGYKIDKVKNGILNGLKDELILYLKNDNLDGIHSSFKTYSLIDGVSLAVNVYKNVIVKPFTSTLGNQQLEEVYQDSLEFIHGQMQLVKKLKDVKDCRIFSEGLISEILEWIMINLSEVFMPGIPTIFHSHYTSTLKFMQEIKEMDEGDELIGNGIWLEFGKKWQIGIYFQIISSSITSTIVVPSSDPFIHDVTQEYALESTKSFVNAVDKLWSENVYLKGLLSKSWKWTCEQLNLYSTRHTNLISELVQKKELDNCIVVLKDVEKVRLFFNNLYDRLYPLHNLDIKSSFDFHVDEREVLQLFKDVYLNGIKERLLGIKNLPGMYRRTNKSIPTLPSSFMMNLFQSMYEYSKQSGMEIKVNKWIEHVIMDSIEFYKDVGKELLITLRKTEDSLRRLKKTINKKQELNQGVSDEDKIRIQVLFDVLEFKKQCGEIGMMELKEFVEFVESEQPEKQVDNVVDE